MLKRSGSHKHWPVATFTSSPTHLPVTYSTATAERSPPTRPQQPPPLPQGIPGTAEGSAGAHVVLHTAPVLGPPTRPLLLRLTAPSRSALVQRAANT